MINKICSKCGILKPLSEFYNDKKGKDGKQAQCKECVLIRVKSYYQNNCEKVKKYSRKWYDEIGREKLGQQSMYKNKECAAYLGIVIGERLCRHLFKDVQVMPMHNPGFDFVCNHGKKIDIKTGCMCLDHGKYPYWGFKIEYNKIADYFICVAFDNRTDLNPLYIWMIPGSDVNNQRGVQISLSTIHKWDKWKRDINNAQLCCSELKQSN